MSRFSAFTSDLTRNPDLREALEHECAKHGDFVRFTTNGKVTTFEEDGLMFETVMFETRIYRWDWNGTGRRSAGWNRASRKSDAYRMAFTPRGRRRAA